MSGKRKGRVAFVIAHYHADGLIGQSLFGIIAYLRQSDIRIVFVSTNVRDDEISRLAGGVEIIVRENIGYDFYSYKIGLDALDDRSSYDHVILMNSSFICVDPRKLIDGYLGELTDEYDVVGLTYCSTPIVHLQSYLVSFSRKVLADQDFIDWWENMVPISDRAEVIDTYELGLSQFLLEKEFALGTVFQPSRRAKLKVMCQAVMRGYYLPEVWDDEAATLDLRMADSLTPTHFMWDELYNQFAVVKRDLIEKNPFKIDRDKLLAALGDTLKDL